MKQYRVYNFYIDYKIVYRVVTLDIKTAYFGFVSMIKSLRILYHPQVRIYIKNEDTGLLFEKIGVDY